jgi:hypothetical protein
MPLINKALEYEKPPRLWSFDTPWDTTKHACPPAGISRSQVVSTSGYPHQWNKKSRLNVLKHKKLMLIVPPLPPIRPFRPVLATAENHVLGCWA